jgi:genome maintenance exonuclease 1
MEWRQRVGEEEANRITRTAASRGKKLHSICEQYLLNEEIDKSKYMPDTLYSFYQFKPLLNKISDIHFLEAPLYSDKLKVAGRVDCIGYYEGDLSIIDFKTSQREKNEEWIEDYFIQACFYSLCYAELTGIVAKNIVILISVEDGENQVFVKKPKEYIPKTVKKIKDYYKFYHKDC